MGLGEVAAVTIALPATRWTVADRLAPCAEVVATARSISREQKAETALQSDNGAPRPRARARA
jgi:hypothetical protein